MKFTLAFAIIFLTALTPGTAISDRVDCTVAENETEVLICDNAELLELDTSLYEEWQRVPRSDAEHLRQQEWESELIGLKAYQIRTLYRWRLVELKFGCVINLSVREITDDLYPAEELGGIIAEADRYFDCMVSVISDPSLTASEFASFYRSVLYTLDWFPDAFMYPISEPSGYSIYASFAEEPSRLTEVLLERVYQQGVITHLNHNSRTAQQLIENQNEWRRYNKQTCSAPIYTSISTYNGNSGGGDRCTNIGIEARILQLSAWIGGFEDYGYPDRSISQALNRLAQPEDMPRQNPPSEQFGSFDEMIGMAEQHWLYENESQYNRGVQVEPKLLNQLINFYWKLRSEHAASTVSDVSAQISRAHLFDLLGGDLGPSNFEPAASVFGSLVNFYRRYEQYLRPLLVNTLRSDALVTDARSAIELFLLAYDNEPEIYQQDFLTGFWERRAADGTSTYVYETLIDWREALE